jgi:HEXXH motif-containing protein
VWFEVAPVYAGRPDFERDFAGFRDAPATHPNLARAVALVDAWPAGAAQARALVHVLHAAVDPTEPGDDGWDVVASSSHSYEDAFGSLWATVHSPVGLAEAIVHEMAHHKLRACGVGFTAAECLVANHPDERYPSPLLGGRPRPMPALVHAHYALLHMVALETAVLAGGDRRAHPVAAALRRRHLDLLRESDATLGRHLVVDGHGAAFMPAVRRWQRRLVDQAGVLT